MKPQSKNAGGRKSEQHPNHPQPKPSSVQSAVGCAHQESDSTATNERARIDHQPSQKSSSARNEPSVLMRKNTSGINTELKVNGQKLEIVTSLKYLGSVITDGSSKPEILSRIPQTTAALTRLKPVWNDRSISLGSKIRLMRSLVTSIFLYACQSWTLTTELQRRIQAMEMSATSRYYAPYTKTMILTRKSVLCGTFYNLFNE